MKSKWWLTALFALYAEQVLGCGVNPIETLFRPHLRGPLMTQAQSKSNQFAGLTTISSGSATQVVSTNAVNSDSILSLNVRAALPSGYNTQGIVTVASGISTAAASTSAVYSGQSILLTWQGVNVQQGTFRVHSIHQAGGSFTIAISSATTNSGAAIGWHIPAAEPTGIKVNTISPGNFFTLGWADGQARPVDVSVMWELRRTS